MGAVMVSLVGNMLVQVPKVTRYGTYEELTVAATAE
jgi:hypothetical protein